MSHDINEHMISKEIIAFLVDRRSRQLSENTIRFYRDELEKAAQYWEKGGTRIVERIDARVIRQYLLELGKTRNAGGVHAAFRSIRAFLNWWEIEVEPDNWNNPIKKVKVGKPSKDPLPGIPVEQVMSMVDTCEKTFIGNRDKAILLTLIDSGVRRQEFVNMDVGDIDLNTGAIRVRNGKGGKDRTTFIGNRTRREIIRYLRYLGDPQPHDPMWLTRMGTRLTPSGLRQIVRRRAERVGLPEPGLHNFRRTFAIESLRNGCDIYSLMRMMGHSSPVVLQRYLRLVEDDIQRAHERSGPIDNI
jgi:integrase/recombinase XerC